MTPRRGRLRAARLPKPPPRYRPLAELLEDRRLPAVSLFADPLNAGKFIVRFSEDLLNSNDKLLLRPNNAGQLEYKLNAADFSNDLDPAPGVQAQALTAISRIEVNLGGGDDLLDVGGLIDPALVPSPGGIVFTAGAGIDTLAATLNANLTLTSTSLTVGGGPSAPGVTFTDLDRARLTGGNSDNVLDASTFTGPVTLDGANGSDTMLGGSGDDLLLGTEGADVLYGHAGNDTLVSGNSGPTLFGGAGNDLLLGGNGQDVLAGEAGDDRLLGGNGADLLDGGAGNDTFDGGPGNDNLLGGAGTDRVIGSGNSSWTLTDSSLVGDGHDTLSGIEEAELTGGLSNNKLDASAFTGDTTLTGGGGVDLLLGGSGSNLFLKPVGEVGDVTMVGGPTTAGTGGTPDVNEYRLWVQGTVSLVNTTPAGFDLVNFSPNVLAISLDLGLTNGTPQDVDAGTGTVALTGHFEQFFGSGLADNVSAADNSTLMGGLGADVLSSNGKSNVSLQGGADGDSLVNTGGTNVTMNGDDGADSLVNNAAGGTVMSGGADGDSLVNNGGANVTMSGDSGSDSLTNTGSSVTMSGGADSDSLTNTGSSVTMSGGADGDSLTNGGANVTMNGDAGSDSLTNTGGNVTMSGGADADSLTNAGGSTVTMRGDGGADSLTNTGSSVTMSGGADGDSLLNSGGSNVTMNGDDGADSLVNVSGGGATMSGGADGDSLTNLGGSSVTMHGDDGADSLVNTGGAGATMNGDDGADSLVNNAGGAVMSGGADGDSLTNQGGTAVTMHGDDGADTLVSVNGSVTMNGGPDADRLNITDTTAADEGPDAVAGGDGDDTYVFAGSSLGQVAVTETAADGDSDTLDFSSFLAGAVTLDLGVTGGQSLAGGALILTLSDGMGIENVVGTAFADAVSGNARDNRLVGADVLPVALGPAAPWDNVVQVVYLDFDSGTGPGDHLYTALERDAIEARLEADYGLFHFDFRQDLPPGDVATLVFNELVGAPPDQTTGGWSSELDFRNLNPGGAAYVQVNGILGAPGQPADESGNWIALSAKIAAHELGHLVGLLHQDSFGPIGYGIHTPPGPGGYNPDYTGPAAAYETFDHLMSSPASVGSDRFNDTVNDLFFGEREAVKLAFAESGTVVTEASPAGGAHDTVGTAQGLGLAPLAVPNTLVRGLNAGKAFAVEALTVTGGIALNGSASESDFYSFAGRVGDVISVEVLSRSLTRLFVQGPAAYIDPMVRIYGPSGAVLAFNGGSAFNDDQFEPTDAALFDVTLTETGTYYVEVDTFADADTPDTDVGQYELFLYRFDAWNAGDVGDLLDGRAGDDVLAGGLGDDTMVTGTGGDVVDGGSGNDTAVVSPGGADAVIDTAGRDTLDFSAAASGVTVNLALNAGQTQTIDAGGGTLAITGNVEVVIGTAFADVLTGDAGANTLFGGLGADVLKGGFGDDALIGGGGNDVLEGEDGRDLLIGGLGADVLRGLGGDDILIGGVTTYDADRAAVDAIMAEWNSGATYAQRVAHLTGTPGGQNGSTYLVRNTTVLNDGGAKDTLAGGLGLDLFFTFGGDRLDDKQPGETVI